MELDQTIGNFDRGQRERRHVGAAGITPSARLHNERVPTESAGSLSWCGIQRGGTNFGIRGQELGRDLFYLHREMVTVSSISAVFLVRGEDGQYRHHVYPLVTMSKVEQLLPAA